MSNNDGAAVAQYMAVGEELSRAMVELIYLRAQNEKLKRHMEAVANYLVGIGHAEAADMLRAELTEME